MQKHEKVKMFSGQDLGELEEAYSTWHKEMCETRKGHTAIRSLPFIVVDRKLVVRQVKESEVFAFAIFYEDFALEDHEKGSMDRAGNVNGASLFTPK